MWNRNVIGSFTVLPLWSFLFSLIFGTRRLFFLRYAPTADSRPSDPQSHANAFVASSQQGTQAASSEVSFAPVQGLDTCCVRVDVRGADEGNDLLTCLSNQLGLSDPGEVPVTPGISMPQPQSLVKPSDVVAFQLVRLPQSQTQAQKQTLGQTSPQSSSSRTPFLYPKYVYLDQFLRENSALTVQKRSEWNQLQKQIKELVAKKESIANFKVNCSSRVNGMFIHIHARREKTPFVLWNLPYITSRMSPRRMAHLFVLNKSRTVLWHYARPLFGSRMRSNVSLSSSFALYWAS